MVLCTLCILCTFARTRAFAARLCVPTRSLASPSQARGTEGGGYTSHLWGSAGNAPCADDACHYFQHLCMSPRAVHHPNLFKDVLVYVRPYCCSAVYPKRIWAGRFERSELSEDGEGVSWPGSFACSDCSDGIFMLLFGHVSFRQRPVTISRIHIFRGRVRDDPRGAPVARSATARRIPSAPKARMRGFSL